MSVEIEISKELYDLLDDLKKEDGSFNEVICQLFDCYIDQYNFYEEEFEKMNYLDYLTCRCEMLHRRLTEVRAYLGILDYRGMYEYYKNIMDSNYSKFIFKTSSFKINEDLRAIGYLKNFYDIKAFKYYALKKFNAVRLGIEDILKDEDFEVEFKKYDDIVIGHWNRIKNDSCASDYFLKYEEIHQKLLHLYDLKCTVACISSDFNSLKNDIPENDLIYDKSIAEDLEKMENALKNITYNLFSY